MRGSGVEDEFVESQIFGPKTVETVLSGGHYYRSFKGLSILGDTVIRLQMDVFWDNHQKSDFKEALREIEKFNRQLIIKCPSQAPLQMKDLKTDRG